jgi:hypothetical protein
METHSTHPARHCEGSHDINTRAFSTFQKHKYYVRKFRTIEASHSCDNPSRCKPCRKAYNQRKATIARMAASLGTDTMPVLSWDTEARYSERQWHKGKGEFDKLLARGVVVNLSIGTRYAYTLYGNSDPEALDTEPTASSLIDADGSLSNCQDNGAHSALVNQISQERHPL